MSMPKNIEKAKKILFYRDEDGRTFEWIGKQPEIDMRGKNVAKIYYREKAFQSIKKRKDNNVTL